MANVDLPSGETGYEVPGFPGYVATLSGKIWSNRRSGPGNGFKTTYVEIDGGFDRDGYRKLIFCVSGKRYYKRLHTVILETFVGPCPVGKEARHENGKRWDNRLDNLSWATHAANIADKKKHGTHQCGEMNPASKYTEAQARKVKRLLAKNLKPSDIARRTGIPIGLANSIKYAGAWSHVKV